MITKLYFEVPDKLSETILELSSIENSTNHSGVNNWQGQLSLRSIKSNIINSIVYDLQKLISDNVTPCQVIRAWCNVNRKGSYNRWHKHELNGLAAVYYILVPEQSGEIEFKTLTDTVKISPQPGELLVFPGELEHRVLESQTDKPRISLALNLSKT